MKKYFLFFFSTLCFSCLAQTPQGINYQAVARNASGNPLVSTSVAIHISVYKTGPLDSVWIETHPKTTNAFGLFNLSIGQGTHIGGSAPSFSNINWATGAYYLRVLVNGNDMGITQFLSVPYSFHATTADSLSSSSGNFSGFSNFQVFNSGGSFTVPAGITKIMAEAWGGGGGGAGATATQGGAGGGGGAYTMKIYSVSPAQNITIVVGNGGGGAAPGNFGGGSGGNSTVNDGVTTMTASGGFGSGANGIPGAGGSPSGAAGVISSGGGGGGAGNATISGEGGMCSRGGGGGQGINSAQQPGNPGLAPGGGGGGGGASTTNQPGGAGSNGRVVIWW